MSEDRVSHPLIEENDDEDNDRTVPLKSNYHIMYSLILYHSSNDYIYKSNSYPE